MMADVIDLEVWRARLQQTAKGPKKNMTNLMLYLGHLREFATLRWNEFAEAPEWRGEPLLDHHLVDMRVILEAHDFEVRPTDLMAGVIRQARNRAYHPIRDYLWGLKWDGMKRLDVWMQRLMGAEDTDYVRTVGRKTLIAAVARVMQPGCKVDTVLVLEGPQGARKSSAIAALFGDEYTSASVNLFDQPKHMITNMMGKWCIELAEFIAALRNNEDHIKGLISTTTDRATLSYARAATDHPRQCIFIGSYNPDGMGYLSDGTGNRRFWPVTVTRCDVEGIVSNRDQLWAEAMAAYSQNEQWWLDGAENDQACVEQAARLVHDSWSEILIEKIAERGWADRFTTADALEMVGITKDRMDRRAELRVAKCLREIGFRVTIGKVLGRSARLWVRDQ